MEVDLTNERTWWAGTHEPAVQEMLQQLIRENLVLYDVGAHIGFFALPAARLGAQVITFEPDPESAARLRTHITRNHLGQKIACRSRLVVGVDSVGRIPPRCTALARRHIFRQAPARNRKR